VAVVAAWGGRLSPASWAPVSVAHASIAHASVADADPGPDNTVWG
jgi:hypothetical protein